jgi:hypothetical protein
MGGRIDRKMLELIGDTYIKRIGAVFICRGGGVIDQFTAFGFVFGMFLPAERAFEENLSKSLLIR